MIDNNTVSEFTRNYFHWRTSSARKAAHPVPYQDLPDMVHLHSPSLEVLCLIMMSFLISVSNTIDVTRDEFNY